MKLSNILLASIITSTISVSAQEGATKNDNSIIKNNTEIKSTVFAKDSTKFCALKRQKDSIKIRKKEIRRNLLIQATRAANANLNYHNNCPGCGRG